MFVGAWLQGPEVASGKGGPKHPGDPTELGAAAAGGMLSF